MSCCGGNRWAGWAAQPAPDAAATEPVRAPEPGVAHFEYTGRTGLTMRGAITGRAYRFDAPGAVVAVDRRDAPSASGIPNLRRVRAQARLG
jgi:hypothetical protein